MSAMMPDAPTPETTPGSSETAAPSVAVATASVAVPPLARTTGAAALVLAVGLVAAGALVLVRYPAERVLALVVLGFCCAGALLLMAGGAAFLAGRRAGRIPLWIFLFAAWPSSSILVLVAAARVANARAPAGLFQVYAGMGVSTALFALALGFALLVGSLAAWAAGPPKRMSPDTAPRSSVLALISLIAALVPPWGLLHVASLILGVLALGRIRRAGGTLTGRAMAWTGVGLSTGVFALIFGGMGAAALFLAKRPHADEAAMLDHLRALAVAQRVDAELHPEPHPAPTTLAAWLATLPAEGTPGPLTAGEIAALSAADAGLHGERAVPLVGYVFRLEPAHDAGTGFGFSACVPQGRYPSAWRVEEAGEPWRLSVDSFETWLQP